MIRVVILSLVFCGLSFLHHESDAPVRIVNVSTVSELRGAVRDALAGDVILLADGIYDLAGSRIYMSGKRDVTLRSASRDPSRVVLRGAGFGSLSNTDELLVIADCADITVEALSFEEAHAYGIKVQAENFPSNIHILNCRFRNIGTRAIKGSTSSTGVAAGGLIRWCTFENTKVPTSDWPSGADYIGGIDMMALEDWTISDNTFRNIRGMTGAGRAAIFIWVRSRRVTVERNVIIGCDLGMAIGNFHNPDGVTHVAESVYRNNFVTAPVAAGAELTWVTGIKFYNNSIWRLDETGRGIRVIDGTTSGVDLANNIVRGTIMVGDDAQSRNNLVLTGDEAGYFVDAAVGNLRLTSDAVDAIDRGLVLSDVADDVDCEPRGSAPDIGADERTALKRRGKWLMLSTGAIRALCGIFRSIVAYQRYVDSLLRLIR